MRNKIFLHHKICTKLFEDNISEKGIVTYISLKSLYNQNKEKMLITIDTINEVLYPFDEISNSQLTNSKILDFKDGLIELNDKGYINILDCNKQKYLLDMSGLNCQSTELVNLGQEIDYKKSNPFETIYKNKETKIINYYSCFEISDLINIYKDVKYKKTIFKYLIYYLNLKYSNENNIQNKECPYFIKPIKDMAKKIRISETSIIKYNKILENNHIIYIKHFNDTKDNKTSCNLNGLYKDKELIESTYKKYKEKEKNND